MRAFLLFTFGYLAVAVGVVIWLGADPAAAIGATAGAFGAYAGTLGFAAIWAIPLLLLVAALVGRDVARARLPDTLYALAACILLQVAFSFLKTAIPDLQPFYADAALAEFDRWLHGGRDPWTAVHHWAAALPIGALLPAYLQVWTYPATVLPVFVALTDGDPARRTRVLFLYAGVWVVLGNVLAVAGSSVGPVYYDALLGGDRFAVLTSALTTGPVQGSLLGDIQAALWQNYLARANGLGLGISAFPSVHVGMAVLTALYLAERGIWLAVPGLAWVLLIQFLAVYSGYHYALDGYVSAALVIVAWLALRRDGKRRDAGEPAI